MSKLVLILLATSVGLGLLCLFLVKQVRDADAIIIEQQSKVAALEEQLRGVPPPGSLSTLPEEPPGPTAVPPPESGLPIARVNEPAQGVLFKVPRGDGAPPFGPSREDMMRAAREAREQRRQLMKDPEYREAMRVQARNNLVRQYPGVVQELGLDPQQASEFFDLLADQQQRLTDQMESLWEVQGPDPVAQQEQQSKIQQRSQELQRNSEAELAARFGQDKLQEWKQYQSTLGARYQMDQMRNALAAQGAPLSDDVSKSVLRALADAQKAEADELSAAFSRGTDPRAARLSFATGALSPENVEQHLETVRKRNQRMLDAISPYLTYEQRQAIEQEQRAQLKVQEAHMQMQRRQSVEGNAGVATRQ